MAAPGGTGADVGGTTGGAGGFAGEGKDDGVAVEAGAKGEAAAGRPAIALAVDVEVCEVPKHSTAEFAELFEGVRKRMQAGDVPLRVATVSLRAPSDQSKWSSVVAAEREMLMAEFRAVAGRVVEAIKAKGEWADFIEPATGEASEGTSTGHATFFETDDRYALFDFDITDFGCCKALKHPRWGHHVYVGSVFTLANCDISIKEGEVTVTLR